MIFRIIIPARYASTRLYGKPLLDIAGKPMLWHVYQRAIESGATQVIIATDDERIQHTMQNFGAAVCMTSSTHKSGTERIIEVIDSYRFPDDSIIVNVQGDEPLLSPDLIKQTAEALNTHPSADMATLCQPISDMEAVFNSNVVKVIRDSQGFALYFSRAPIPWQRDEFQSFTILDKFTLSSSLNRVKEGYARHIGIYAYRASYLRQYKHLSPCLLEQMESLEQLRVLYYGGKIYVSETTSTIALGVDTLEDLERVRQVFMQKHRE